MKTFYKCWLEVAGFLNIVYKCWLEDAGYEFCLQMLAGGLQSLNIVNKCWLQDACFEYCLRASAFWGCRLNTIASATVV